MPEGTSNQVIDQHEQQAVQTRNIFRRLALAGAALFGSVAGTGGSDEASAAEINGSTRVDAGKVITVIVAGKMGIPANAEEAFINVIATNTAGPGFLSVVDCKNPKATSSMLNFGKDDTVSNNAIVDLKANNGAFCLMPSQSATEILVDVTAVQIPSQPSTGPQPIFDTLPVASRVADTRNGAKPQDGQEIRIQIAGVNGVPAGAEAVMMNVTATQQSRWGFATLRACDAEVETSTVNWTRANQDVTNTVAADLDDTGAICAEVSESDAHLLFDVQAYHENPDSPFVTLTSPKRANDDRQNAVLPAYGRREIQIAGVNGVPKDAAIVYRNTTVEGKNWTFLSETDDCTKPAPNSSAVNVRFNGDVVANGGITKLNDKGSFCEYAGPSGLYGIQDVIGYILKGAETTLVPLPQPVRVRSTREVLEVGNEYFTKPIYVDRLPAYHVYRSPYGACYVEYDFTNSGSIDGSRSYLAPCPI